jgi:hypothetical protein
MVAWSANTSASVRPPKLPALPNWSTRAEPVVTLVTAPFSVKVVDLKLTALTNAFVFVAVFVFIVSISYLLSVQIYGKYLE